MPKPDALVRMAVDCPIEQVDARRPDEALAARRRAQAGQSVRIAPGAYVRTSDWESFRPEQRHVLLARAAVSRIGEGRVFSHLTAAAFLTIPFIGRWPPRVQVIRPGSSYRTTNRTMVLHGDDSPELDELVVGDRSPIVVTGLARTAVDLAMTLPFRDGVIAIDRALALGVDRDLVLAAVRRRARRGRTRALRVLDFADGRSESVGESLLRVRLDELGAPRPDLQVRFRSPGERDAVVDLWFPEQGVIVEFDGEAKYRDRTMRNGRSATQVVIDEKYREDRLRALPGVAKVLRLCWADLFDLPRLRRKLIDAGIPLAR